MLDEVDAPLDDNNTLRFSTMLKKMSSYVQFVYVTHNKITMEAAEQLLGVTMEEAGVSRLVDVNIVDAIKLAEPADSTPYGDFLSDYFSFDWGDCSCRCLYTGMVKKNKIR